VAAPWIDIGSPEAAPLTEEARRKLRLCQEAREHHASKERYHALQQEAEHPRCVARRMHWQVITQLFPYLQYFYEQNPLIFERHLIVQQPSWSGQARLQSYAVMFSDQEPDLKPQRLTEYQVEIQAFTAFLKRLYFSN
jgi:hypothetical protein